MCNNNFYNSMKIRVNEHRIIWKKLPADFNCHWIFPCVFPFWFDWRCHQSNKPLLVLRSKFFKLKYNQSSNPKDCAISANFAYDSKYCLPFGVITNVCFPSNSILFIKPAPVKFDNSFDNLECDKLAFVIRAVVFIPSWPDASVTVKMSPTICMLVLYETMWSISWSILLILVLLPIHYQ